MIFKHVIWDWNGTLLNDRWLCLESINKLLSSRNKKPLSDNEYLEYFDFPVKDYYVKAGFDFSVEDFKIPAIEFIDLYELKRKDCRLQEDALLVLNDFHERGIAQYLLSASESAVLNDMVDHFGLRKYFKRVYGLNNHYAESKLDLGRKLLEDISASPEEVLMVGDTCHDHEVASAMGVPVILYNKGHFPEYRLQKCGGEIISDLKALIQ